MSNFGGFASPERNLVFDVNDFDETLPGAWEWDVKRLAASIIVAGRENGYSAQENRQAVVDSIKQYQTVMQRGASMKCLDVWYAHIDADLLMGSVKRKGQKLIEKQEKRASRRTSEGVFPKLAEVVDGQYRIKDEPPLIVHVEDTGDVKRRRSMKPNGSRAILTPMWRRCQMIARCCSASTTSSTSLAKWLEWAASERAAGSCY